MAEVQIVLGVTADDWGSRLADWIADHAEHVTVRDRYALEPADVLTLDYDCLVLDHEASMLTGQLVARLHRDGRAVVGVADPAQPGTRERLERLGVDATVASDAEPRAVVELIMSVVGPRPAGDFEALLAGLDGPARPTSADDVAPPERDLGTVLVVTGASGGVGATELAIELAAALRRRNESTVLVDADFVAPSLAQRLFVSSGEARTSNLLTAIDAVHRGSGTLRGCVTATVAGSGLVCGLEQPGAWETVAPDEIAGVVTELATRFTYTVVQTAAPVEQVAGGRHDIGRRLLALASDVFLVAEANPVGLQRLTRWMWLVRTLVAPSAVHIVCNRSNPETRADIEVEVRRTLPEPTIDHLPDDGRVRAAAWALELVSPGPYTRAVEALVDRRLPAATPPRTRRFARRRGRR